MRRESKIRGTDHRTFCREEAMLSEREYRRLSAFIEDICGIKMSGAKKTMLETRLRKRLRTLDLAGYADYVEYLFSPQGMERELVEMINVVTTNKTDFFREPGHFDYLTEKAIPELLRRSSPDYGRKLRVWSAGCSTGEEPYTLAMVLNEFASSRPAFRFSILATDICTTVLEKGKLAIYEQERIAQVAPDLRRKYFLRSKDRQRGLVRVAPELRSAVRFRRLNFMDENFALTEPMEIIFCRNVIIYFDRATQEALINKFCDCLTPGGFLFLGHSETLSGLQVPLVQVNSTIYRKRE
ncbi:MAG: chemotaxis protein CheR [Deltaproteobacteria bacterium]|nr:chemotaxis protein CheR [Deltaproteobacteria bacterium]